MAVIAQVSERNWPAQDHDFVAAFDPAWTRIRISLEHPDWPEGECIRFQVLWPGGQTGQGSCGGGPVLDKAGNPTGGTKTLVWECAKPQGVDTGTVRVTVVQALRSAVLVEGF